MNYTKISTVNVQVPRELFYTASMAGTLAGHLGVFGHRPDVLGDLLAGRRVELEIAEGETLHAIFNVHIPHIMDVLK